MIKVEAPDGDPLRRWSASGASIAPGEDGALFNHLARVEAERRRRRRPGRRPRRRCRPCWRPADAVVWSRGLVARSSGRARDPPGPPAPHRHLDHPVRARRAVERQARHRVHAPGVVGWRSSAWPAGDRTGPPIYVGGQIGEWLTGAVRRHRHRWLALGGAGDAGELVDVSMLEALATCLTYYPVTFNDQLGRPMRKRRFIADPRRGGGQRRAGGARLRHRPAVARLLRDGRPSRVDGRAEATSSTAPRWPRPSTPGSRSARWRRCSTRHRRSASRTRRSSTVPTPDASTTSASAAPSSPTRATAPPTRGPPYRLASARLRPPEPAPRLGEHSIDAVTANEPRATRSRRAEPCRSAACACST